jgi:hypothetical protein
VTREEYEASWAPRLKKPAYRSHLGAALWKLMADTVQPFDLKAFAAQLIAARAKS